MGLTPLLVQWNCRSLRANGHWLRNSPALNAQITCLQETFLDPSDTFSLPNKTIYRADRASTGGGLLTAVSRSLPSFQLALPPCPPNFEALGISVFLYNSWIKIINIYSPQGLFPADWMSDITSSCDSPLILAGDFNINILPAPPPLSPRLNLFSDWLNDQELCLVNMDTPTRTGPSGQVSLLDLTLLSPLLYSKIRFYVHPDQFDSDHHPIILFSSHQLQTPSPHCRPRWTLATKVLNNLPTLNVDTIQAFEQLCSQTIIDTSYKPRHPARSHCPWWDSTCSSLLALKRKHLRLARAHCSRDEWLLYKKISAKLRRHIKRAARLFWDSLCLKSCDSGSIYKILRNLASRSVPSGDNIIKNPDPLPSVLSQADAFLAHFSKEECGQPIPYDLSDGDPSLDAPFTLEELRNALSNTRPTTPGADGISAKLLKNLSETHLRTLLDLYNKNFDSGDLPLSWKLATIIPVPKPGKPAHLLSSYRPIALTSVCCKVFERMLLRRLISWCGQRHIFHQDHYGFLPTRDCTVALSTFLHDILLARSLNHFVAAVCLDIKAAYDSVCPEILTYKLAKLGIRGKTARWLNSFTHGRRIQIRWKSFLSTIANCLHGVPQGSGLSPFLFLLYLLDIDEILESGVFMIVYADDLLVYVIDPLEDRARRKLLDTLTRLQVWCRSNELSVEPTKCTAINFSRRRDPGPLIKMQGMDIPWCSPVRILGVWFTRSLCFTPHFNTIKIKVMRQLNFMKFVTNRSRGVTSLHMIKIINSTIRSRLEYGAPLFFDSPASALRILDTCYNAAIRLASGLPRWTPLPVLRREADSVSISSRLFLLTKFFILRLLSSPPDLRLGAVVRAAISSPVPRWKWWRPLSELLDTGIGLAQVLQFSWPPPPNCLNLSVVTHGYPFQDTSLPDSAIRSAWHFWFSALPPCTAFATDASKDAAKTSVAAVDCFSSRSLTALIPHANSIFTAEALAIYLALSSLPATQPAILLMSDSLSVLRALENWSFKSPTVILLLVNSLQNLSERGHSIQLVWCPAHKGIPPNEKADNLAKYGPYNRTLLQISPQDIRQHVKNAWKVETDYAWLGSDYAPSYSHLSPIRQFPKWVPSRRMDVAMARWRSRTILTNQRLYKMNMTFSPVCNYCYEMDTAEHILLSCPRLNGPRLTLCNALSLRPPITYSDIMVSAFRSHSTLRHLIHFTCLAFPDLA